MKLYKKNDWYTFYLKKFSYRNKVILYIVLLFKYKLISFVRDKEFQGMVSNIISDLVNGWSWDVLSVISHHLVNLNLLFLKNFFHKLIEIGF
jgi:hypothetical protein